MPTTELQVADQAFIAPFLECVDNVMSTMLGFKPTRIAVRAVDREDMRDDQSGGVCSVVGISGAISGVVSLNFPQETALALAGRLLETEFDEINSEVVDAVAELANIVAGSAKSRLGYTPPLELGLPTVLFGARFRICYPRGARYYSVPYESEAGKFVLKVAYCP